MMERKKIIKSLVKEDIILSLWGSCYYELSVPAVVVFRVMPDLLFFKQLSFPYQFSWKKRSILYSSTNWTFGQQKYCIPKLYWVHWYQWDWNLLDFISSFTDVILLDTLVPREYHLPREYHQLLQTRASNGSVLFWSDSQGHPYSACYKQNESMSGTTIAIVLLLALCSFSSSVMQAFLRGVLIHVHYV